MNGAREDPRAVKLRQDIIFGLERTMQLWSTDAETGQCTLS